MSSALLILEDNHSKVQKILMEYEELCHDRPIFICRSVIQAQSVIESDPGTVTFFLDYELAPGCGTGLEFLEWLEANFKHFIDLVVITSYGIETAKQMARFCQSHNLPVERLR